jgi:D-arabinose 1-dehydrogenase-like Zn-dependent alcohol dehydrogenase
MARAGGCGNVARALPAGAARTLTPQAQVEPSMARMKVIQVPRPNAALELIERDIPEPGARQVRIKVQACGICHSDTLTVTGALPGINYPRVPGHEVVGLIDAIGAEVPDWKAGMRVGVGWHGGHCGHCDACRRGDFITCIRQQIPGISYDGGYAEYMIAPFEALAAVPEELSSQDAAPLLCAGITTFNSLRHTSARAGDLVAVLGIGGLGHLAVQSQRRWAFAPWPSRVARTRGPWPGSSARTPTSTAPCRMSPRNSPASVARR